MRAFIAVDLPAELRVELGRWQEKLRKSARGARWVRPEGIHLTLKFLGEISSAQVIEVSKILSTLPRIAPFEIHFKGFGFFPHAGRPRVLWVGIEPCPTLEALAAQVDKSLETVGVARDQRAFKPHLTLARFRVPRPQPEIEEAISTNGPTVLGPITVREFFLFESILRSQGAEYRKLARFPAIPNSSGKRQID